jgi:hypothetical protein
MSLYINISEKHNLLIFKWTGEWNESAVLKGFYFFKEMLTTAKINCFITDSREVQMTEVVLDFDKFIQQKSEIQDFEYKHVYLVNNPKKLVSVHMYADALKKLNKNYFYCNTLKKAIELLSLNMSEEELDLLIKNAQLKEL